MATGIVKSFNNNNGYGLIAPDDGGEEIFVFFSQVDMFSPGNGQGLMSLTEGQTISYDVTQGTFGKEISNIQLA